MIWDALYNKISHLLSSQSDIILFLGKTIFNFQLNYMLKMKKKNMENVFRNIDWEPSFAWQFNLSLKKSIEA